MRLVSFRSGDRTSFGAVKDDGIVDVGRQRSLPTLGAALRAGALQQAMRVADERSPSIALDEIAYVPTVPDPEKIICIGINYGNRNEEYKDGVEAPRYPSVFMRTPGSLVGHGEPIMGPAGIRAARLRRRDRARDRQGRTPDRARPTRGATSRGSRS